ncbi:hypothetical protein [Photobacterium lutimaris]|uniref:Uncharacterized protein n=1 Tax=Photobacterium lutimaris TaxID=388278 RepID=A0A2T3ITW5_9GAMM|nr:hypothetical protein [Photobacterium lutimaris]PSU31788.1 hypothetical protein C9I99_21630 [Photobacterium lutimaris]TDR72559.1 hypothetical protein DFP78_11335 [Photobacterium lutimaris]
MIKIYDICGELSKVNDRRHIAVQCGDEHPCGLIPVSLHNPDYYDGTKIRNYLTQHALPSELKLLGYQMPNGFVLVNGVTPDHPKIKRLLTNGDFNFVQLPEDKRTILNTSHYAPLHAPSCSVQATKQPIQQLAELATSDSVEDEQENAALPDIPVPSTVDQYFMDSDMSIEDFDFEDFDRGELEDNSDNTDDLLAVFEQGKALGLFDKDAIFPLVAANNVAHSYGSIRG